MAAAGRVNLARRLAAAREEQLAAAAARGQRLAAAAARGQRLAAAAAAGRRLPGAAAAGLATPSYKATPEIKALNKQLKEAKKVLKKAILEHGPGSSKLQELQTQVNNIDRDKRRAVRAAKIRAKLTLTKLKLQEIVHKLLLLALMLMLALLLALLLLLKLLLNALLIAMLQN